MTPLWAGADGSSLQQTLLPGLRGQPNVVQEPGYTQLNLHLARQAERVSGKEREQTCVDRMRGIQFIVTAVGQAPPEVLGFGAERCRQPFYGLQGLRDVRRLSALRRRRNSMHRTHRCLIRVLRAHGSPSGHTGQLLDVDA